MDIASELSSKYKLRVYPRSIRNVSKDKWVFVARDDQSNEKLVGLSQHGEFKLSRLTWDWYEEHKDELRITPSPCDRDASLGTGDRLGMVAAAHLSAFKGFEVFPIVAQQSPRELNRTGRTFQDVLLAAVLGVLESGFTGTFGADADHIKDEHDLVHAIRAGYSMYTIDVSDWLVETSFLNQTSLHIISEFGGKTIRSTKREQISFSEERLRRSALLFQDAMENVKRMYTLVSHSIPRFDLEVSVDEAGCETTLEDHVFVAEYMRLKGVKFTSLAPRFHGEFQKGVDFRGDISALKRSFEMHANLCRELGGYRLSLHSGSDKFSIYEFFRQATEGRFHVKTSGTSWLQAVVVIARVNPPLCQKMYTLCLDNLEQSKLAYDVSIQAGQFPCELPADVEGFLSRPDVRQLFHISYGALLKEMGHKIRETLQAYEEEHYLAVRENIAHHLSFLTQ